MISIFILDSGDRHHGKFGDSALWNDVLLTKALPELWIDALKDLTAAVLPCKAKGVVSFLPNLDPIVINAEWRPCAEELYRRAASTAVLPHIHGDHAEWVQPQVAMVLTHPLPSAFQQVEDIRNVMMDMYVVSKHAC